MREHNYTNSAPIGYDYVYSGGSRSATWNASGESFAIDMIVSDDSLVKPLLPKPHSYRIRHSKALIGWRNENYGSYSFNWHGALIMKADPELPVEPHDIRVIENEALDKLNEKVRGSLDLSVSGFEYKQTQEMLKLLSPKGLRNYAQDAWTRVHGYRGKPRSLWDAVKDVSGIPADAWLQYQYGWKPLVSDIYGIADESLHVARNSLTGFTASSMRRVEGIDMPYSLGYAAKWSGFKQLKGKWACKYGLVLDAELETAERLARWTSLNPVSIAWELLPYSFVVDWFYDIGGFLRAIETSLANNVSFVSGYKSTIRAYEYYPTIEWDGTYSGVGMKGQCAGYCKYVRFNREVLSSYPLPNVPRFKSNLGSTRLLSAAALLQQWLPKRIR